MTTAAKRLRPTQEVAIPSTSVVSEVTSKACVKQYVSLLLKLLLGALPDVTCALHNRPLCSFEQGVALQQLRTRRRYKDKHWDDAEAQQHPHKLRNRSILGHVWCKQHGHEHMKSGQLAPIHFFYFRDT